MSLRATCPNNPGHKLFITAAHVIQDWIVDENGEYLALCSGVSALETTHGPDPGNTWECFECGAEAVVEEVCCDEEE